MVFIKQNILILALILTVGLYLGIKSFNGGWDGWGFGSAQTLMSNEYWAEDGFIKNYFLFIPRPYSKLIHYFDEPEFRNRPIENLNGELARDRRLYYTHYPPLYLFPYAIIAKLGIEDRSAYRIFSLLISLVGLLFFYLFIKSISTRVIAIIASIYYGFSVTFLNYADSVSIQPWTVLFTFLILYLSVLAKRYNLLIWISYFALSLSSYDATFFVFSWLVLYDAIILKKFLWRRWLFFALAPIFAFALQMLQNIWYLGATEMWQDIYRSYAGRAIGTLKGFISGLVAPFVSITGLETFFFFKKSAVATLGAVLIFGILWKLRPRLNLNNNFFRIIIVLAAAAIAQPFLINVTGHWPYQGVLTAPFWGLLIGASSMFLLQYIAVLKRSKEIALFIILFFIVLGLWSVRFYDTLKYVKNWPNNKPAQEVIGFGKSIKSIAQGEEKIAFRIIPQNPLWKSQFPVFNMEYYMDMPTIDFANSKDLVTDFKWLHNRSEYPYYSLIIAENKSDIENLRNEIKKILPSSVSEIRNIQDQHVFVVNPN